MGIHRSLCIDVLSVPYYYSKRKTVLNKNLRSNLFRNQLTRQLGQQKRHAKDGLPQIIIIRVQAEILEEIIRVRLADITPVEIEREESDTAPGRDLPVDSSNKRDLLGPGPSKEGIEAVAVFVFGRGLEVAR